MPPDSQKLYTYHYMNYATGIHADSQAFKSRDKLPKSYMESDLITYLSFQTFEQPIQHSDKTVGSRIWQTSGFLFLCLLHSRVILDIRRPSKSGL